MYFYDKDVRVCNVNSFTYMSTKKMLAHNKQDFISSVTVKK